MEKSSFSVVMSPPIYSRSYSVHSRGSVANYPRSSTPLRDVNRAYRDSQELVSVVQKKSSVETGSSAANTNRKCSSHADDVRLEGVNRQGSRGTLVTGGRVLSRSRLTNSFAGKLQQQKREVILKIV